LTNLIEPAPSLAEQLPSAQLLLARRVVDRLDARAETFAEVGQLGRERQRSFGDEGESAPIRVQTAFLSLVHESSRSSGGLDFRALRAHRVRTAVGDVRIIIPLVGTWR